jgi:hypothetical protein
MFQHTKKGFPSQHVLLLRQMQPQQHCATEELIQAMVVLSILGFRPVMSKVDNLFGSHQQLQCLVYSEAHKLNPMSGSHQQDLIAVDYPMVPQEFVTERLTSKDRDVLYENRINPIASFPSTGIVVFGQKTLQERQSALDRINVRRLVIYLKKQISILSTQVLFEQNVQATWNRFKGLIEPFLANVKVQFGITDYRLILDDSTTTPDLIDQNIMYAKIMVKPARAIEFIAIDFVIASTGASFDD